MVWQHPWGLGEAEDSTQRESVKEEGKERTRARELTAAGPKYITDKVWMSDMDSEVWWLNEWILSESFPLFAGSFQWSDDTVIHEGFGG